MLNFFFAYTLFLSKDEKVFMKQLYEKQIKRMWYISSSILKNKEQAEDTIQSAFIKLIENIELLMNLPEDKVNGYVYVVTKNLALYQLKRNKREELIPDDTLINDKEISAELEYLSKEEFHLIKDKMSMLSETCKEVIYLHHILKFEYKEIAPIMHITVNNARQKVYDGLKKLRKIVEQGDFND